MSSSESFGKKSFQSTNGTTVAETRAKAHQPKL